MLRRKQQRWRWIEDAVEVVAENVTTNAEEEAGEEAERYRRGWGLHLHFLVHLKEKRSNKTVILVYLVEK